MGVVHRGLLVNHAGEKLVAIKRLVEGRTAEGDTRRLLSEGRLVFGLNHANICQVVDLAADERSVYLVLEYVDGLDLHALVRRLHDSGGRLSTACAVYAAREVARGLGYAHRQRNRQGELLFLVHGDVSPRNILLSVEGDVKLTDFGIARAIGEASPGSGLRGGTPGYTAPEVYRATPDFRADLFSLGASLWFALTGRPPPEDGCVADPGDTLSSDLVQIVRRCVAPNPQRRFASAEELERALALEIATRFPGFTPADLGREVRRCVRRKSWPRVPPLTTRLFSLGHSTVSQNTVRISGADAQAPHPPPPSTSSGNIARTVTADGARPRRRGHLAVAALCLVAAVATGGYTLHANVNGTPRGASPNDATSAAVAEAPHALDAVAIAPTPPERAPVHRELAPPSPPPSVSQTPSTNADPPKPRRRSTNTRAHRKRADSPARAAVEKTGYITVTARPWGVVYIDDRRVASETPLVRFPVKPGRHSVKVFQPTRGSYTATRKVTVRAGATQSMSFRK